MVNQTRVQSFIRAQEQADDYLQTLLHTSKQPDTYSTLVHDIQAWSKAAPKVSFVHKLSFFNSSKFIKSLASEHKLEQYLKDSLAYLFVRDLDLDLADQRVCEKIDALAQSLSSKVVPKTQQDPHAQQQGDMMLQGYQWAKSHDAEDAFIWLSAKIYRLKQEIPEGISPHQGMRKLLKVVAGTMMHQWQNDGEHADFATAIRLGYYYGLTYPLIDDLQDASVLTDEQKLSFQQALEQSILTGKVQLPTTELPWLSYVFGELAEAFSYIQQQQGSEFDAFLDQAYIFLKTQQADTNHAWQNMINKSSRSRILADALVSNQVRLGNYQYFGLFNQLHDDLKDIDLDYAEGNITPFVALVYENKCYQDVHPYQTYWALLHYLIYQCYHNEPKVKALLIKRCVNAHKSLLEQLGEDKFNQRLAVLSQDCPALKPLIKVLQSTLAKPLEMAWLDKYLSEQVQQQFAAEQNSDLKTRIEAIQGQIKQLMPLSEHNELERAANYSLLAGGKYFRGVLATLYAQDCLNLQFNDITPVVRFIEYMHTASLIFDDKPSQDNSDLRRGKPTLHQHLQSEAKAEISAVNLILKAVEVHAQMGANGSQNNKFNSDNVLKSLEYASQLSQNICHGQWLDLDGQGKSLGISELETISLKKTAYAIESALVLPAILTAQSPQHIASLQKFSYHLGIAFQIKDDLLDVESDQATLGKPAKLDIENQTSTFVTCLGRHGATEQLYTHYYQAIDALSDIENSQALAQMAFWLVERVS